MKAGANFFVTKPLFQSSIYNIITEMVHGNLSQKTVTTKKFDFQHKKVLLAEDNELNREIAVQLLKYVNLDVITAEDGKQAIEQYDAHKEELSLILMDIQMPFYNGYQATQIIRSKGDAYCKKIPILAMTANAFTEDIAEALASGMNDHIAKPIDTQAMYQKIQKYIL
jgi:CheY-like chemotaxis protein